MDIIEIQNNFRDKVDSLIRLESEGINRYRVIAPFRFEDGDHLVIILKQVGDRWILSDEGHTIMHLTYIMEEQELQQGTRQKIISNTLSVFGIEDQSGELITQIRDEQYGDALFSFIEALIKISDLDYLSRERVRSTFREDFNLLIAQSVSEKHLKFDWHEPKHDPGGKYLVDCRINDHITPLFVYGIQNDDQTRDATISLLQFEKWGLDYRSIAIFENQENIGRKVLARFSDVCEKQYSNIGSNKERISKYFRQIHVSGINGNL
jgi:hypothetical protein